MSILIALLPSPPKLAAQEAQTSQAAAGEPAWRFVFSSDERHVSAQGAQTAAALAEQAKAASQVIALVAPADVTWHRATLPKVNASKLKAVLQGALEDALLDDAGQAHLAISPDFKPGEAHWVASLRQDWLTEQLRALEDAGVPIDRVMPLWAPDERPAGHVFRPPRASELEEPAAPWLAWRDAEGPLCVPLMGDQARSLTASVGPDLPVRWTASPDCADAASSALGANVATLPLDEWMLQAARGSWNFRQFDLIQRRRRGGQWQEAWRRFVYDATWRPVRLGLLALLGVQLVGANVWAWQQRHRLSQTKQTQAQVFKTAFPAVRVVTDAPAQMRAQMNALRGAAGQLGEADFESLMQAAESAWPPGQASAQSVSYQAGVLTVQTAGNWTEAVVAAMQSRLRAMGADVKAQAGTLLISAYKPDFKASASPAKALPRPGNANSPAPSPITAPTAPMGPAPGPGAVPVNPAPTIAPPGAAPAVMPARPVPGQPPIQPSSPADE